MSRKLRFSAAAAVLGATAAFAPLAQAATLTEASEYSSNPAQSTLVGAGYDSVSGSLSNNDRDFLAISLGSDPSKVELVFSLADTSYGNNSSFVILYSYSPFVTEWYSNSAQKDQYGNPVAYNVETKVADTYVSGGLWWEQALSKSYTINADPALGTTLYLSLIGNGGNGALTYNITGFAPAVVAPAEPEAPAPVPLPAGVVLLGSALGLGGLVGLRRKRKAV